MHRYFIKTPWIVRKIFSDYLWRVATKEKEVYLTFDDGPHPTITPWVLEELRKHHAKASFFCIGDNVRKYPEVYRQIISEGHAVGNHTDHHLNGWKTNTDDYVADIAAASGWIKTALFRPPYGRLRAAQARRLAGAMKVQQPKVIMWDVLSADFDPAFSPERCLSNVTEYSRGGSIIVFHDSEKARKNLEFALPRALRFLEGEGYVFRALEA
jgi:peptidoglycan/xylan/chitin deacetylase (PgdA/CDA1 family)